MLDEKVKIWELLKQKKYYLFLNFNFWRPKPVLKNSTSEKLFILIQIAN
jgi:hypothetical protein